ncbi:sialate O-acetylesterase [Kamptonema cortianum]|nr:sialate O-acetylesterase [Geitlerinema splendidum]MDK3157094.1 sialate O-acetylesterase [Kamptonema cortianum]
MLSSLLVSTLVIGQQTSAQVVQVYILAGQSNMVGHGFVAADSKRNDGKGSLEALAKDPKSDRKFHNLLNRDGTWRVRDDVWIHFLNRHGKLTVGYGAGPDTIGPELGFGFAVGDAESDRVLLVKLAWGGKSLAVDFRPPSSGGAVGPFYSEIIQQYAQVVEKLPEYFPELKSSRLQLAGFGWHQGWNDRINGDFVKEYEKNMVNFIRDIRRDLKSPDLPFVIAETGMGGEQETNQRALDLMKAQAAVAEQPEFKNNVAFVGTREFWRPAEASPSNQGYHWNSNAETYFRIGDAMGEAMIGLIKRTEK